ncbi:probable xyloglucan 6-xylosyltransferase 1 [Selaginella moellendorffii]|nr:probable xyloglucan 6-xylosyltransferase 1 [Selaginella moellendorffii]|eukprot:XP_002987473.2 probable xyloglucan 6-xylosyltransferase 1 [Selaginella moellendorffii]
MALVLLFILGTIRALYSSSPVVAASSSQVRATRRPLSAEQQQQQQPEIFSFDPGSMDPIEQSKPRMEALMNRTMSLGPKISDWDSRRSSRRRKIKQCEKRMMLVTSSHPKPCENPLGDHIMLKSAKNKMDYCRLHGIDMFYNVAKLERSLPGFWIKIPLLRAVMLSHPEFEWILWMDGDALFTDMTFRIPIRKYEGYNLVMNGWDHLVYGNRSWTGLNMGIFLIRNCQWSLDLLDILAQMGSDGPGSVGIGKILHVTLFGRPDLESDDQGALLWLMNAERERWGAKIFLEHSYALSGFWVPLVRELEDKMRRFEPGLGDDRWPFVTHFAGCEFCEGWANYSPQDCRRQMERAFNFGDNQVLEMYGFRHPSLNVADVDRT